jgi:hypothetical protein
MEADRGIPPVIMSDTMGLSSRLTPRGEVRAVAHAALIRACARATAPPAPSTPPTPRARALSLADHGGVQASGTRGARGVTLSAARGGGLAEEVHGVRSPLGARVPRPGGDVLRR